MGQIVGGKSTDRSRLVELDRLCFERQADWLYLLNRLRRSHLEGLGTRIFSGRHHVHWLTHECLSRVFILLYLRLRGEVQSS